MVSPHPDLQRRFINTDNIIKANKSQFAIDLFTKYPKDYIDISIHKKLEKVKPWIDTQYIKKLRRPLSYYSQSTIDNSQNTIDKILVLCVDFNDKPNQISISKINDRFFSTTENSLLNYFKEVSYSKYISEGEVHGWYRAPQLSTYYTNSNYGFGPYPYNVIKLVGDVIDQAKADPTIDWASFDTNNDEYLSSIIIIHSGAEAASTGNPNDFWAHISTINPQIIQGKNIYVYAMTSEFIKEPSEIPRIGVDAHELAHLIGLPDLYDTTYQSNGVGTYSLMGAGSWANGGITPTHLDAWSKNFLNFSSPIIDPLGSVSIKDAETNPNNIKYTTPDPKEYFLIENRQNKLYDIYLPSNGVFIWHINENQIDKNVYNDDKSCYLVGLVQADNLKDLENLANDGDSGDSYPGSTNNRSFGVNTSPNSFICNGKIRNMLINNISDSSNEMNFNSALYSPELIQPVAQAGFSPVQAFIIFGFVIGMIYSYTKKQTKVIDH